MHSEKQSKKNAKKSHSEKLQIFSWDFCWQKDTNLIFKRRGGLVFGHRLVVLDAGLEIWYVGGGFGGGFEILRDSERDSEGDSGLCV